MIVTRIPPSPTGHLHIGTARTALFNYLFAKHHGGLFLLRSEDTDKERSTKEYEDEIREGLSWLGLEHDGFSRQSEQAVRHQELLEKLLAEGKAFVSSEEKKDAPGTRIEIIRLKNPGTTVVFHDEIRGDISFDTGELGDFAIARSIHDPLYHFAVVADDMDAGVTHVIRGEDHISNTPRQILIQEALGAPRPMYAHLPLILASDRSKLSKRHGATSVMAYRDQGILPEGMVNYLALLGWHPEDEREYFSLQELVGLFSLERVQKGGAVFDTAKLESVNQHWMRGLSDTEFVAQGAFAVSDQNRLMKAVPLLKERAQTFGEARAMLKTELGCLFATPQITKETLSAKEPAGERNATKTYLTALSVAIKKLSGHPSTEEVKAALMPYAEEKGRGAVLWPLRYALSGEERSPDPFTLISILGRDESVSRLEAALAILGE